VTETPPASELPGRGEKTATSNLNEEQNSGALIRDIQAILGSKIAPLSANFLIEYDSCGPSPPTIGFMILSQAIARTPRFGFDHRLNALERRACP
jgi:hypothetical protein